MRVLVATPMVRGAVYRQALDSALSLKWPERLDYFAPVGGDVAGDPHQNVTDKYNVAREVMLAGPYEAMLTLDSDIIPPPDALMKLAAADADVAYGLYVMGRSWPIWSAHDEVDMTKATPLSKVRTKAEAAWGKVVEVKGMGHGCTLFRRHVLEQLEWRLVDTLDVCSDWIIGLDCVEQGFSQVCDMTVICGHIRTAPMLNVMWPDIEMVNCYRRAALPPVPLGVAGAEKTYTRAMMAKTLEGYEYDRDRNQVGIHPGS
ncbi:MAG TPA: hypothetical protein VMW79_10890 [Anaerolineae bacterium]|nr:hypothetical protein [Anaerolineae bacterium]